MRAKSPSAEPASRCNGFSSCFLARPAGSRADREAPPPFSSWPLRLRWHPPVFCAAFQDLLLGNPKASRALRRHTGKGGPGAQSEGNCYYSLPPHPRVREGNRTRTGTLSYLREPAPPPSQWDVGEDRAHKQYRAQKPLKHSQTMLQTFF